VDTTLANHVIGQADFYGRSLNRGSAEPLADSLSSPSAAVASADELFVADTGNHRVLVFSRTPVSSNFASVASRVLGQDGFEFGAPNLLQGREFRFINQTTRGPVFDAGIAVDQRAATPHLYVAGNAASTGLCGGWSVTAIPTATVKMTRLSCHRFRSNEVRLWLSLIADNLGNLWRRLVLPKKIGNWSLTSLQQRLVKTGGRLVKHARYYWLMLAESHLTRRLFGSMVRRIDALAVASG